MGKSDRNQQEKENDKLWIESVKKDVGERGEERKTH